MNTSELIKKVEELPFFGRVDVRAFGLPEKTTEVFLSRAVNSGKLLRLKRGVYTSRSYFDQVKSSNQLENYREFLANIMVSPSYVSTEYVLSKHELISEAVYSITSITTGRPVLIENDFGSFRYRNTSNSYLSQFETIQAGSFLIKRANKIQALFDYLYLKKKDIRRVTLDAVRELRLNIHLLSSQELRELKTRSNTSNSIKLKKIIACIERLYADI
jgi:predicted transcriptional regulator of viral defense system